MPDQSARQGDQPRRAYYFNAGFLKQKRVRRILELAGYDLKLGQPRGDDLIAVWGRGPYAHRGEAMAEKTGASLIRIEDAFLRSLFPGRSGEPPLGLMVDHQGVHFDSQHASDLELLLATHPLDDTPLLNRSRAAIARLREAHLSKYAAFKTTAPLPDPGYVLVVDQLHKDASVKYGQADANTFREMLTCAQLEHPGAQILIKTHPETIQGHRAGYYSVDDANDRIQLHSDPISPWHLLEGACAVYTASSQMGFEAIFAGHRPQVFGQPFYAGWGLTEDRNPRPLPRRGRNLTKAQLFAAAMILYPKWYNPFHDQLCEIEDVINTFEATTRCWREDHSGWHAEEIRLWKRPSFQTFFGTHKRVRFGSAKDSNAPRMIWASKATTNETNVTHVEDGFLRSKGLGAELTPPLSLVCDDLGIYYDPTNESRLERLITQRATLRPDQERRVEALITSIKRAGLSKYNIGQDISTLTSGHRILVPGQVEDDASIKQGTGQINTNLALLERTRQQNPDAVILFKPHPDVEAGLRSGAIPEAQVSELADHICTNTDPSTLLEHVDEVWTMTSLMGFEALMRGLPVTTTGAPFYAGWGLTRDLGDIPARRTARPDLHGLIHATLIDYPRYHDPVTDLPCPVEVIVGRLSSDAPLPRNARNRLLSKLQGLFASHTRFWR
ncbi:capsular polysaccharide biosynthesis protein [Roseovarius sp. EL26]|uniref:capsular polysaccharide biosynthesis protein n=1 Tax=Roseovarius sp. EL26 TaxID=2126672 RepID=UPI000EA3008E|nr:capsular polysaccharide biosynthesis protein [Roseovarius sp. EL26]